MVSFDTISHELLLELVERRVGDVRVVRLIRAWLKAGVLEEGRVTHPDRGSPQGGVVSPLLSNVMLHEVDRQWCRGDGTMSSSVVLVRYADDMVLLARTELEARQAWERLQSQFAALRLVVNQKRPLICLLSEGINSLLNRRINLEIDDSACGLRVEAAAQRFQEAIQASCSAHVNTLARIRPRPFSKHADLNPAPPKPVCVRRPSRMTANDFSFLIRPRNVPSFRVGDPLGTAMPHPRISR